MADARGEVTVLLGELRFGRQGALARLMPLVYRELRRVAGRQMRDERPGTVSCQPIVLPASLRGKGTIMQLARAAGAQPTPATAC